MYGDTRANITLVYDTPDNIHSIIACNEMLHYFMIAWAVFLYDAIVEPFYNLCYFKHVLMQPWLRFVASHMVTIQHIVLKNKHNKKTGDCVFVVWPV